MHTSHRPFVVLVTNNTDKYSESEIIAFLEGSSEHQILAKAFELWSCGNSGRASDLLTGQVDIETLEKNGEIRKNEATATPS